MFTHDTRTETFLDSLGVKHRYDESLRMSNLIDGWSKNNIGRSQDAIETAVIEYAELMHSGSPAPAPIVKVMPDGQLRPLDGIQRLLAADLQSLSTFAGYVIQTDSEVTIAKIRVMANARLQGGYQESKEWTLERAVQVLVIDQGLSHQEIAALGGWQVSRVRDKHNILETKMRVRGIGGPSFSDKAIKFVHDCSEPSDFVAASQPIAEFLNELKEVCKDADETRHYIQEFFNVARNKPRIYQQFMANLDSFRSDDLVKAMKNGAKLGNVRAFTPDGSLLRSLRGTLTTAKNLYADNVELSGEMETYFQIVNQIQSVITKLGKRRHEPKTKSKRRTQTT